MSLGSFGSFGSSGNSSLAWSMGNGGKGRLIIEFPFALDSGWYKEQPCTRFQIFEHRKEKTGFQHEFIVLKLLNGSVCRIERMGDPNARFDAVNGHGSLAYDMIQCFAPEETNEAQLSTSDLVAEVTLPCVFDILDVLKICRAIHEEAKTRSYTLQVSNCYFFSLAIQACLTRLITYWEDEVFFTVWISQIKDGLQRLAEAKQSPIPLLEHLYSILTTFSGRSGSDNSLIQRIERDFRRSENAQNELSLRINSVLWHWAIDMELDQLTEEWVRDIFTNTVQDRVDALAARSNSFGTLTTQDIKKLLLEIVTEKPLIVAHTLRTKSLSASEYSFPKSGDIKQKLGDEPIGSQEKRASEMSYIQPPSAQIAHNVALMWYWWLVGCFPYLCLWALHAILELWGVTLFTLGANASLAVPIEDKLCHMLRQLEHLETVEISNLEQCATHTHESIRNQVTIWNTNPWSNIRRHIKAHVTADICNNFEKFKAKLKFYSHEQPVTEVMDVLCFQRHIFGRIKAHAQAVERAWLGSATVVEAELEDMLSRVWRLIREDKSTPTNIQFNTSGGDSPGDIPRQNQTRIPQPGNPLPPVTISPEDNPTEMLEGDTRSVSTPSQPHQEEHVSLTINPTSQAESSSASEVTNSQISQGGELEGETAFTSRRGKYQFPSPTPINGPLSLVNNWHARTFGSIPDWDIEIEGSDYDPTWVVVPILLNQRHDQYRGYGKTKGQAKEDSAIKIMKSGHCVSSPYYNAFA